MRRRRKDPDRERCEIGIAGETREYNADESFRATGTHIQTDEEVGIKLVRFFRRRIFFFLSSFVSVLWAGIDFRRLVHVCSTRLRGRDSGRSARLVSRAGDRTSGEDFETLFLLTG